MKNLQNFVAFSEYRNFIIKHNTISKFLLWIVIWRIYLCCIEVSDKKLTLKPVMMENIEGWFNFTFKFKRYLTPLCPFYWKVHSINAKANLPILWEKLFCTGGLSKYYRAEKLVKLLQCKGLWQPYNTCQAKISAQQLLYVCYVVSWSLGLTTAVSWSSNLGSSHNTYGFH